MAAETSPVDLATVCGRHVRIGHLSLGGLPGGGRVTLNASCAAFDHGALWMSLTAAEARELASALLRESAAVDAAPEPRLQAGR